LSRERYKGPDEFGFYVVRFADGVDVEFNAGGLDGSEPMSGCASHVRGIGPLLMKFVFDVAQAGDFVIFNCQGEDSAESPVLILVYAEQERELPADLVSRYANRPVCESPEMLGNLLFRGYGDWKRFRDQVVGGR
jgi:hypothetical protein